MVQTNNVTLDKVASPVMEASNGTLLSIQNLRVWFELKRWGFAHAGYVRAVDDVSFDLARGDAIAIVGESGSGKTSLMKTILGLNRPIEGDIIFDGQNLSELGGRETREYRSKIGFVQQDPYGALPPFMSVQRILAEPLVVNGVKDPAEQEERIRRVMDEVKLNPVDDFIDKFPHMLSGGQQQRVVIARAMILEPKLIVADEPVSMLDASVRVEILKLLENLQQTHDLAVIYITHDLSTVRYFSERIFVMYAGKLIEKSPVDGILYHSLHPYTDALLQGTSEPDAENAHTFKDVPPGEPPSLVKPPPACRFHPRCPHFMKGLCDVEDPLEYEPLDANHYATCWLYSEKAKEYAA
jgi:peptide/nickel transport system ATP-binding protein